MTGEQRNGATRSARTLLEHLIRAERGETYEEFAAYAEEFARRHRLPGTLSLRHLLRLASGRKADGCPLGTPRPATVKLLEHIFGVPIGELLAPPRAENEDPTAVELRQRLNTARHVDRAVIDLLHDQLNALRRLDRQMGAVVAYGEVREKMDQVRYLHSYCLTPDLRALLAGLLCELGALAGWEALDRYAMSQAWEHHEVAKRAAREAESSNLLAHVVAQQALVLAELGEVHPAVQQLDYARCLAERSAPRLLRAWLAAAYGEGLAAAGQRDEALRAFAQADALLPPDPVDPALPFLFLKGPHLDRWRGHAFARLGEPEAAPVLIRSLERLDSTFTRAETALRVDLAIALTTVDPTSARDQMRHAERLATEIGSARQQRRIRATKLVSS